MSADHAWFLAPAGCAWLLAVMHPGVRAAYANGWRCLARHPVLWKIPAGFAAAYALFQAAGWLAIAWRTDDLPPLTAAWSDPVLGELAGAAALPALETLASGLNCLVATFPVSALCAALFLVNHRGLAGECFRSAGKRFGPAGHIGCAGLALCALCAVLKPFLILAFPELVRHVPMAWLVNGGTVANALAFVFEYLLGTCLQIVLVLVACGWIRGLRFDPERLIPFAVRRLGSVFKWSGLIIAATLGLIHLPMLILAVSDGAIVPTGWEMPSRAVLAAAMIALCSVQIRLILHHDTLRGAISRHGKFLRRHAAGVGIFLSAAFALLWTVRILEDAGTAILGPAISGIAFRMVIQIPAAVAGGWILAAWVCFYKSSESGSRTIVY
ncbi:MAG TPA: hypothetical protein PLS03_05740 [Terrimicrobiaceae bacterium]|nr:hypothetical protein [Terrimicrobiaceae bacterium]